MLALRNYFRETVPYLINNCVEKIDIILQDEKTKITAVSSVSLPKAIIFHDSFCQAMQPFLSHNFSQIHYLKQYDFDRHLIEKESPDVVIMEMVERNIGTLSKDVFGKMVMIPLNNREKDLLQLKIQNGENPIALQNVLCDELNQLKEESCSYCRIDTINGEKINGKRAVKISKSTGLRLEGWAIDKTTGMVPDRIYIKLTDVAHDTSYYVEATRYERMDVATHFNNIQFRNAGFKVYASIDRISVGTYRVSILQQESDRKMLCEPGNTLQIE